MNNIKAILFDSGRVLNYPSTGHWFITPNFWQFVDKTKFYDIDKSKLSNAFRKADDYIMSHKLIITKDEELQHFIKFYETIAENLPELQLNRESIHSIANDLVFNADKYTFYDDALNAITEFHKKYKLAIVSDAWPSLLDVYDKNGLTNYFNSIVISSLIGTTKPDPKMYLTALKELNVEPQEAVLVDDSLKNCSGAVAVGINTLLLCRDKRAYITNKIKAIGKKYKVINSLNELEKYINLK